MIARPVFVIDSDAEWCARVCRFLEPHGIPVVVARTTDEALGLMHEIGVPGALVMDIAARRTNGRAVTTLRHDAALRNVPVGYVRKSAALDALLLLLRSSAAAARHYAA